MTSMPAGALHRRAGGVHVRPMVPADIAEALAIEQAVQLRPWTQVLLAMELSQPTRTYLVATDADGGLLAFGGIMVAVEEAHVINIAVAPEQQGHGVATILLLTLLEAAVTAGARAATLEVRVANSVAQRLYRRFGFAPVGVRPGYYAPEGEDAVIMWVHDLDGPAFAALLQAQRERLHGPRHDPGITSRGRGDGPSRLRAVVEHGELR